MYFDLRYNFIFLLLFAGTEHNFQKFGWHVAQSLGVAYDTGKKTNFYCAKRQSVCVCIYIYIYILSGKMIIIILPLSKLE